MLESAQVSVTIATLFVLAVCLLIGSLFRFIWVRSERRTIEKKWQERERQLDSRRSVFPLPEILEWSPRPPRTRDVPPAETAARVLYIVARDQPELFTFLRKDFAAEEAEGVIEILVDRRHGAQRCEADGRDPRRNGSVSVDLREIGFSFARQPVHFSVLPADDRPVAVARRERPGAEATLAARASVVRGTPR